jgi:hypothetical protein
MLLRASRILCLRQPMLTMAGSQRRAVALHFDAAARAPVCALGGAAQFAASLRPWWLSAGVSQAFSTSVKGPHETTQEALAAFSVADVETWVADIPGVRDAHVKKLTTQEVDGEQLLKMTKEELRSYGIPGGPAGKIMDAIERVKSSGAYVFWHATLTSTLTLARLLTSCPSPSPPSQASPSPSPRLRWCNWHDQWPSGSRVRCST